MFYGSFNHSLDNKNRCRIPARLRSQLGDGAPVIVKGQDRCLYIYSASHIESLAEQLKIGNAQQHHIKALRLFLASMYNIEEDNQKRFTLNNSLKEYANINKEIVFLGVNGRIEMWSKEAWEEYNNVDENTESTMFETLAEYGL